MQTVQTETINNRQKWLASSLVFFASLVFLRLIDIQVLNHRIFRALALENRIFTQKKPLIRGTFLDRYGQAVASNQARYYFLSNPEKLFSSSQEIEFESALPLLATQTANFSMINTRWYPFGESLAQTLGFVGPVSKQDLLADRNLSLSELVGKSGLEFSLDKRLLGQAGEWQFEINALGDKKRIVQTKPGKVGEVISTTLDPYLSKVALEALDKKKGAVVILDGESGEVLSLVSSPSFDPNVLTKPALNQAQRTVFEQKLGELLNQPNQPFFNRAISGAYPPGSVFKLVTALAALESGKIDEQTQVNDEGVLKVGEYSYANWYFTQYGRTEGKISLKKAIARSNDIFFYKAAELVGPEKIAQMARRLGFGGNTKIELSTQHPGLVPDPEWKQKQLNEPWYLGNTYHFGIGQGDLLVTPLQIAQMTQAVAYQGVICPPHILKTDQQNCESLGLKKENLELVLGGMLDVCSVGGTAFPFFTYNSVRREDLQLPVFNQLNNGVIACKTGTAEWGGVDERGYRQTHAWFTMAVGLPADTIAQDLSASQGETASSAAEVTSSASFSTQTLPELRQAWLAQLKKANNLPRLLVITVLLESDESKPYAEGSADAAPIAKTILDWMLGEKLTKVK